MTESKIFKILFIGDIVARHGRKVVKKVLPGLKEELGVDYVIANGENLTTGQGLTVKAVEEMHEAGIDFFTSGNHVWRKEEFIPELDKAGTKVIRPANYPPKTPGRGYEIVKTKIGSIMIANLLAGEGIPATVESPFWVADRILSEAKAKKPKAIIVDFHAEITSEKVAMGHYLDGRVTAVLGTHTHVPTADNRILPNGTAYISDVGMVGPLNSVLGVKSEIIIERYKTGLPQRFDVAEGEGVFNAVMLELTEKGKALSITRIDRITE